MAGLTLSLTLTLTLALPLPLTLSPKQVDAWLSEIGHEALQPVFAENGSELLALARPVSPNPTS